ncbi:MAG: glycosyltransferase family 4 protein [bacterium]|nr:glycosyltransferase family 4 protein [bacterium]
MKLIYLANIGLPTAWAHGIQIMKMCEALAEQGVEVELVAPRRRRSPREDPFAFFSVKKNFKIKFIPCLDLVPGHKSSIFFWLRLMSFLLSAKIYLSFKKFDALYTRDFAAGLFFTNYYLEIHSMPDLAKNWHKKVWRRAKALFVLTSIIKQELEQAGVPGDKISVAPDGVDLALFDVAVSQDEARQKLNLPEAKKIILYSGSFYMRDWKGVDVLLEAVKAFPADCLLILVGGQEKEIKEIKQKYAFKNIIIFGRQPHDKIPYFLKAADVLVLPNKKGESISAKYTSPMKLFEYMASGRPILASDLPSLREVLSERNSYLIESDNPEKLAGKLKEILADPGLAREKAERARQDARQYAWSQRAAKIIKFIGKN